MSSLASAAAATPRSEDAAAELPVSELHVPVPAADSGPGELERGDSTDSVPDLVNSSSSEDADSDEEFLYGRNVRPRRAGNEPSAPRVPPPRIPRPDTPRSYSQATRGNGMANQSHGLYAANPATQRIPLSASRPAPTARSQGPIHASATPDMGAQNLRQHHGYRSRWNSAAASRQGHQSEARAAQAVIQVGTGAVQVVGLDDLVGGDGFRQDGTRQGLGAIDFLSSILGMQGLGLDPNSEGMADIRNMPLDPIWQVLQASFNLPPQRKPKLDQEALVNVMLVRISDSDAETRCPISGDVLKEGQWAARMPCGHYFGMEELVQWLDVSNSCPVCRYELPTDDAEYNADKQLSLEKAAQAAASACTVEQDVIGQRMARLRHALDESTLHDCLLSLGGCSTGCAGKHDAEAAVAAAKRQALFRYYALYQGEDACDPEKHGSGGRGGAEEEDDGAGGRHGSAACGHPCDVSAHAVGAKEARAWLDADDRICDQVLVDLFMARQSEVPLPFPRLSQPRPAFASPRLAQPLLSPPCKPLIAPLLAAASPAIRA